MPKDLGACRRRRGLAVAAAVLSIGALLYVRFIWVGGLRAVMSGARCVVIDPGHGGEDPGAVGKRGTLEKDIVLKISMELARLLQRAGIEAVLTRTTDVELGQETGLGWKVGDLSTRVRIANSCGADIFVSIHANADVYTYCRGAQVFYRADLNRDSERLAKAIQTEIARICKNTDRDVSSQINQYVLKNVKMPAATVEIGFLSNPEEEMLLASSEYQSKMAWAICSGILKYFREASQPR